MKFDDEYKKWLTDLKGRIRQSQIKAAITVNTALIEFYWDLGKMIAEKEAVWGSKLIEQVAKDLKQEFPDMQGLSRRNLFNAKKFYQFYNSTQLVQQPVGLIRQQVADELQVPDNKQDRSSFELVQQVVALIPWGHNILIFTKSKELKEALFYVQKTKENNWSRDTLALQIKSDLYARQGKAITNFTNTLPEPNSDLAQQTLKDPYVFDFLQLTEDYKERDIENQLIRHITRFLLELGKGFAFVGRQYNVQLNQKEYFIDLLFYHIPMQCYVIVELKNKDFEPEFAGKLNFYLTLIDKTMKRPNENPTIGILLCRGKDNLEVEYALQDIHKPMGVSEFKLDKVLPDNLKSSLPSIEELEEQLKKMDDV
jgi:predicted nuclease of restriction endonuclease-like (RecB) superfamily